MECYRAITQIDKEQAQLQNKKLERYEAYRSGEISREEFIKAKDQITTQADELAAKKNSLKETTKLCSKLSNTRLKQKPSSPKLKRFLPI